MIRSLVAFEILHHVRSPLFMVSFGLFFLLSFGATTLDEIQVGSIGNVMRNSPYAICQMVGVLNLFGVFVTTAFVANAVLRDEETRFGPILYSTRLRKRDYVLGRFMGAVVVAWLACLSVPIGILLGSLMPWLDAEKIGPWVPAHYAYAVLVMGVPTQWAVGAVFFAMATATRSMLWTYVGLVAFLVGYGVSQGLLREDRFDAVSGLVDPFGLAPFMSSTRYWTASDRNTLLPPLEGLLLWNRVLWMVVGTGMVGLAWRTFRMETRAAAGPRAVVEGDEQAAGAALRRASGAGAARVGRGLGTGWAVCVALTRFDMAHVFRSPAFVVLLALGIVNSAGSLLFVAEADGTPLLPVTRAIVDALGGAFVIFPVIIAAYYGGELAWRDRESGMHEITDATRAPNWAFVAPKVLAISLVLMATLMAAVASGMGVQWLHGYTRFELGAYLLWFVVPRWVECVQVAVLSVAVQSVVPSKPAGWGVMLVYLVSQVSLFKLGFQHSLYSFGDAAAVPLSDMNGMGHFWVGRAWQQAYWGAFCGILLVGVHLLRVRGVGATFRQRLRLASGRLRGGAGVVLGVCAAAWVGTGAWVFYNTNILNVYRPTTESERLLADAERELLRFEKVPQPTVLHVELAVDIEPSAIRATTTGRYWVENRHGVPVDRLHVTMPETLEVRRLTIPGGAEEKAYPSFGHRIIRLEPAMVPGERRDLLFETVMEERGFVNRSPQTAIVRNGTFLNNSMVAPTLGVPRERFLKDRSLRRKHGLPPDLRPPALEDRAANRHHCLRHDSDWVTAEITVTTDADQVPVAPGRAVRDETANGRRTRSFRTESPIQNFFSIQSARYAVASEDWAVPGGQAIRLEVYHHPPHTNNVARMLAAMKDSLGLFSGRFSPYQFNQLRILEFPSYAEFAQSFANTVPYSEALGFIQNYRDSDAGKSIDLVTYVTAHEVAHQWWAHQVIGADKQGSTMLMETFAQYSALLVMERLHGRESVRRFLKRELDRYLRSRGGEVVEEVPLSRVEDQPYIHYRKGSLVMWRLKEEVGEEVVNRSLRRLIERFGMRPAPYPDANDFLAILREEAGPRHGALIADLFERITLYDLKATGARVEKRGDGKFDVTMTVEARKVVADGQGKETEVPMEEAVEVGMFRVRPDAETFTRESVIRLERRMLKSGKQEVRWVSDEAPACVGIDPLHFCIDRNSADNLRDVPAGR